MFNKNQKGNSILFTASILGAGAAAYYLTKAAKQGEDKDNTIQSYSTDYPVDYYRNDV